MDMNLVKSTSANTENKNIFVMPLPIGSTVYRRDGMWKVHGYDCDYVGDWRIKLKRSPKQANKPEFAKPLVSMYGKSFWNSYEAMLAYFENKGEKV